MSMSRDRQKIAASCRRLAKKLGCDLDRHKNQITIYLPDGLQVEGNPGLHIRVNEGETLHDSWAMTERDLEELADHGMEPRTDEDYFLDRRLALPDHLE